MISSLGCQSRSPRFVSICFPTWLKVKVAVFYYNCLGVFLTWFLISLLGCHGRLQCFLSIIFPTWLKLKKNGCFLFHLPWCFSSWSLDKILHLVCSIVKKSLFFPTVVRLSSMLFCNLQTFSAASKTNVLSKSLKTICCIRKSVI